MLDAWRKTSLFHLYYSASPSLGQAQESPLKGSEALSATASPGNRCICWKVMAKLPGNPPARGLPELCCDTLSSSCRQATDGGFWRYPGMTHGQMFDVSLQSALLHLSGQAPLAHQ